MATDLPSSRVRGAVLIAAVVLPSSASADSFSRGSVELETRTFTPDGSKKTEDVGLALVTRLEIKYEPNQQLEFVARGVARFDALDSTRNIGTPEDAYAAYTIGRRLTLRAGMQILNWSAAEAFTPADIINSRNYDSDSEAQERLGEPMVEMQVRVLQGTLSLYYMPFRISPNIIASEGRLSLLPHDRELGDILWIDRDGTRSESVFAHQGAMHFTQTVGSADIAVHVVDHNDRVHPQPTLDLRTGRDRTETEELINVADIRPTFHWVTQFGLTYVQVFGSLIFKLEAAHRWVRDVHPDSLTLDVDTLPNHQIVASGLEYGWVTLAGHTATIFVEGQAVLEQPSTIRRNIDVFQRDVFIGYRHGLNDEKSREVVFAFISDLEKPHEYVASLRYAQALSDTWSMRASLRSLRLFDTKAHYAQLALTRNF